MDPTGRDVVVQMACWLTFRATAVQPVMGEAPVKNSTVPLGAVGVKVTLARVAVKVTDVFSVCGLAGAGGVVVRLIVGASALTAMLVDTPVPRA